MAARGDQNGTAPSDDLAVNLMQELDQVTPLATSQLQVP